MKKALLLLALTVLITGCATQIPVGFVLIDNTLPMQVGDNSVKSTKVGTAMSQSYLGMIAIGDSSIQTAAQNGGITKISHVDWKVKNILGFIGEYTTTVYGE
ncbi:MAG: TRL-like family protein [Verrucomicrobia bacterium]|nr:TRL-like family protein [Verrucomicrobiota bacterium]